MSATITVLKAKANRLWAVPSLRRPLSVKAMSAVCEATPMTIEKCRDATAATVDVACGADRGREVQEIPIVGRLLARKVEAAGVAGAAVGAGVVGVRVVEREVELHEGP